MDKFSSKLPKCALQPNGNLCYYSANLDCRRETNDSNFDKTKSKQQPYKKK